MRKYSILLVLIFQITFSTKLFAGKSCDFFEGLVENRTDYYKNSEDVDKGKYSYGYAYAEINSCLGEYFPEKENQGVQGEFCRAILGDASGKQGILDTAINCAKTRSDISVPNEIDWLIAPIILGAYKNSEWNIKKCDLQNALYQYRLWRDPYVVYGENKEKVFKGDMGFEIRKSLKNKSCKILIKENSAINAISRDYNSYYTFKVGDDYVYTKVFDVFNGDNLKIEGKCVKFKKKNLIEDPDGDDCSFTTKIDSGNYALTYENYKVRVNGVTIKNKNMSLVVNKDQLRFSTKKDGSYHSIKVKYFLETVKPEKLYLEERYCEDIKDKRLEFYYFNGSLGDIKESHRYDLFKKTRSSYMANINWMVNLCLK